MKTELSFFTLLLLISFASVNAVLFTPALPNITHFFCITYDMAQQTMTYFLIGYAVGQLFYGPIANRFGRKPALYLGISMQVVSSLLCIIAGVIHFYGLLVAARLMMALGAGVGLKMTFTLINESYIPKVAAQKTSYLMLSFAITPGLGVALGGVLNACFGWISCFYVSAIYGLFLLFQVVKLPETQKLKDINALKLKHLMNAYMVQFKNIRLVLGGLLMGTCTSFIYLFAALGPFIAINLFGTTSEQYGLYSCIPSIGLVFGSLVSARFSKSCSISFSLGIGIVIAILGCVLMLITISMEANLLCSLFLPMTIINFGLCFIMANASVIAMDEATDKAHGAAVMSFINMGLATVGVFSLSYVTIQITLLPLCYLILCAMMLLLWMGLCSPVKLARVLLSKNVRGIRAKH